MAISIFPIGIIGAGTMGCGVAELAAAANHTVHVYDRNIDSLLRAENQVEKYFHGLVEKRKITAAFARESIERIHFDHRLEALEKCRLVLEAIPEDMGEKISVLKSIEPLISESCILATNTSSLSIASLAGGLKNPERFLGLHFFNPATAMALVEVVPGLSTLDGTVQLAKNLVESWGKVAVVAKDTPGFIVNRVVRPYFSESLRILEESVADAATIDSALKTFGDFRMGPFELMDFVGVDINWSISKSMFEGFSYDQRFRPSLLQQRLVEARRLGRKTGFGFYDYSVNDSSGEGAVKNGGATHSSREEIFVRVISMLINEAADALFWRIGTRDDIDTAVEKGVNFPRGLLRWADEISIQKVIEIIDRLYNHFRDPRYWVSPMLRHMAATGERFYN